MIFPAKIILFGEHIILQGASALVIPWPTFYGTWKFSKDSNLQQNLPDFWQYLQDLSQKKELDTSLDLQLFKTELDQGLYFESNVPLGYGVGSSGSLCAGILRRYEIAPPKNRELTLLQAQLGQIESFFHGTSSGIDPLISYINKPVLIEPSKETKVLEALPSVLFPYQLFVLDTQIPRKTGPLVEAFLKKSQEAEFYSLLKEELIPSSDEAIAAFLEGKEEALFQNFSKLCSFQLEHMKELIPPAFYNIWEIAKASSGFKLKICGAGGGGFLMGLSKSPATIKELSRKYKIRLLN